MGDPLFDAIRQTLPPEVADILADHVLKLGQGDFEGILSLPVVRQLLGHEESDETQRIKIDDFNDWRDYNSRRLGILLDERGDDSPNKKERLSYRAHVLFFAAVASLQAFVQANVTGPPLSFRTQNLIFGKHVSDDPRCVEKARSRLKESLSVDGESVYRLTPNVELLYLAETILSFPPLEKTVRVAKWVHLRALFIHQRLFSEKSPGLQESIYDLLSDVRAIPNTIDYGKKEEVTTTSILLEEAAIHNHHGFDKKARECLAEATEKRSFEFALTGFLGKRTRFQEKEVSQLVVLAKSSTSQGDENQSGGSRLPRLSDGGGIASKPQNLDLNDDTLLETISFETKAENLAEGKDSESLPASLTYLDPGNQPLLEPLDSIILLSLASSITNTSPADGLTREETLPYAVRTLEGGSSNWQVYTQALLVRSRIEGYKSRTAERGLLQLQALVDQVRAETNPEGNVEEEEGGSHVTFLPRAKESESASASDRLQYVYSLCSPTRWELEAELASRWVAMGGLRSAMDIYERLELWPEAALCWAATDREDKARRILRRQLYHATNGSDEDADPDSETWDGAPRNPPPAEAPRMYCILGDIDHDISMYEKAWEISGHRYARAQRSIGRLSFAANDLERAADAYSKAIKVNQLNHASWFALGCVQLQLCEFGSASESFARVVQLDDEDAEAWSNLAAALLERDRMPYQAPEQSDSKEVEQASSKQTKANALRALKRAARLKNDNPRIWDNILTVSASMVPPSFTDVINAQLRLVELRGPAEGERCIDDNILAQLVRQITNISPPPPSAEIQENNGPRPGSTSLPKLLVKLLESNVIPLITSSAKLWRIVAQFYLWQDRPAASLSAHEKAWRAATSSQDGWESGTQDQWDQVVAATVELTDAYESLGQRAKETSDGKQPPQGEIVARDWRFKARSAARGVLGKARDCWEGSDGWERLQGIIEGLKGGV
ncbi:MAG: hypothetical protein M1831_000328 [Alyxoria varia]|nr:MAG: hypothetical protein M1831_000328 [Alyxoria varia]